MDLKIIKKESIIFTTIDLINEHGIQGVSTREVARRQGISQGMVFQYFPKKNDLLGAVLEHFSLYDNDIFDSTKIKNLNCKDAIIYYIDSYATYYENYPAITAVAQAYEVLLNDLYLGDKVKRIFRNRANCMKEIISQGQSAGIIRQDLDCDSLADIITSTQRGICLKWRIESYNFPLREKTLQAVNMLLDVFSV